MPRTRSFDDLLWAHSSAVWPQLTVSATGEAAWLLSSSQCQTQDVRFMSMQLPIYSRLKASFHFI